MESATLQRPVEPAGAAFPLPDRSATGLRPHAVPTASVTTVQLATDIAGLQALWPAWADLVARCPQADLFITPAWHSAWWRAFGAGRSPWVISVWRARVLIGVMPLCLYRDALRGWRVRVVGTYDNAHASRSGLLALPGEEAAVVDAVAECLAAHASAWEVVMLRQLPAASAWLAPLQEALARHHLTGFEPQPGIAKCVLPLAAGWPAYVAAKGSHFRKRLNGNLHRLQRLGAVNFRRSDGGAADFLAFERLEARSWKQDDGKARLAANGWQFQRELASAADAGIRCHNLFLELDGVVVGGVHALSFRGIAYSMQTLFDESVRRAYAGRIQFGRHVQDMFAEPQLHQLDLNGNSRFCHAWADDELGFVDLQVYNRRTYSALLATLKRVAGRHAGRSVASS